MAMDNPIEILKQTINEFARRHPHAIVTYSKGHRVIDEGTESTDFFLIQRGYLSILIRRPPDGREEEVSLRYDGDLIGETAILQHRGLRVASVVVVSTKAVLIRISREDILSLIRYDASGRDAVIALWELAAARRAETQRVLEGDIRVENKVMSVLMADIHNYTKFSETVVEELSGGFLFEFANKARRICQEFSAKFENQGDGFKVIFDGLNHESKAVQCAASLSEMFLELRLKWAKWNISFHEIGLGIGVCTDCMSIRREIGSEDFITSHAISVAAAISKHKIKSSDVEIYVDDITRSMLRSNEFKTESSKDIQLERLGRSVSLNRLIVEKTKDNLPDTIKNGMVGPFIFPEQPISLLFLASAPNDEARLRLGEEARVIEDKIRLSRYRGKFNFHQRHALRANDLVQALLDYEPQIVHFAGHGGGPEGLCLEGPDGKSKLVSSVSLSAIFREFATTLQCVVLNACFSEIQGRSIVKDIPYVIGMQKAIDDEDAIAFAEGFYQALGAGKQIEHAYRLACALMSAVGKEDNIPILLMRESLMSSG